MSQTFSNVHQQNEVLLLIDVVGKDQKQISSMKDGADHDHDVGRRRTLFLGLVADNWR